MILEITKRYQGVTKVCLGERDSEEEHNAGKNGGNHCVWTTWGR